MVTVRRSRHAFALAVAMLSGTSAGATTYAIDLTAGAGSVFGKIITDDTLGLLTTANIVNWNLLINDGLSTVDLFGPVGSANSQVAVTGAALTATPTALFFDFGDTGPSTYVIFQGPTIGSIFKYFCLNGTAGACSGNPSAIGLSVEGEPIAGDLQSGVTLIGIAAAVPEPATWALLIGGFVATGVAARRSRGVSRRAAASR